jgi:hypothetical protein
LTPYTHNTPRFVDVKALKAQQFTSTKSAKRGEQDKRPEFRVDGIGEIKHCFGGQHGSLNGVLAASTSEPAGVSTYALVIHCAVEDGAE